MPFLRVVRDKRGYETTYLIHSVGAGSQHESRVLYAFRSPSGVRVGRDPFDPAVRREIEAGNPGITFDWDALASSQHLVDASPDQRRLRRRPGAPSTAREPQGRSDQGRGNAGSAGGSRQPQTQERRQDSLPQTPRLAVPSVIEGDTPELRMRFLAHWHGILCEQLPLRISDPARREGLMSVAQRLNPAGWIDADEIAAGMQGASEALERLSSILTKRRRKPRRNGQRAGTEPGAAPSLGMAAGPSSPEAAEAAIPQPVEVAGPERDETDSSDDFTDDEPDLT